MRAVADDEPAIDAGPSLEHKTGCPAQRVERYTDVRPNDRQIMAITRCIDCGSQRSDPTGTFQSPLVEGVQ